MVTVDAVYKELNSLKKELRELKDILIKATQFTLPKKIVSLKGILKGVSISDEDIKKAKKSLFKSAGI
ncbi:MAG: hypothetical protein AB1485_02395 [Candidatus Thermoplasmatota archaeon]